MEKDTHPNFMLCGTCHVLCEDKPSFATRSARYRPVNAGRNLDR
jgi:hypothetical protein